MSRIRKLRESYARFIAVPWRDDAAAAQRVIICVYSEADERRLRSMVGEFELATSDAGHDWALFDLTNTFAEWLSGQRYAKSYFKRSSLIGTLLPKYLDYIADEFSSFVHGKKANENTVIALMGAGSLFGLLRVKEVVDRLAPMVSGRLVVLFPGTYANNNYRLLNGYDGWNYLAVPITADSEV